jgi:N-dimethylarginine dimethylaminohydrolase
MFRYSVDSEYKLLKAVLLCRPHPEMGNVCDPQEVLHLAKIDYLAIEKEFEQIVKIYKNFRIKVYLMDSLRIGNTDQRYVFNLLFTRDHFLMTPRGAIMARMFSDIRRSEITYAQKALNASGVSIRMTVENSGTFEGADALWVNDRLVVVGVGNRTNAQGFRQIKEELKQDGIKCICVPAPHDVIHLLGALQFIDFDTALIRVDLIGQTIIDLLKENKIKMIMIPENIEVRSKQAMNFVMIAPRKIIMSAGCPKTKRIYERSGIKIAAEIPILQLVKAGGGIACATGILSRSQE